MNYGGIGAVIGHEMTHGFDDQGRKFDGDGALTRLVDAGGRGQVRRQGRQVSARSIDAFEPFPGAHVKGELTMGENIADLGGLLLALDAYHASLHGKPAPVIDGLTGDQRFFLGWAQVWREKMRDGRAAPAAGRPTRTRPAEFRVDRPDAQHRRLVRGLRREGRQVLPRAGRPRADLVTARDQI